MATRTQLRQPLVTGAQQPADDDTIEADFEVVDDDEKKDK